MYLVDQRQRPAEILLEDLQYHILGDVWREYTAVGAHHGVAFLRGPMAQAILTVPPVHHSELGDVMFAREYRVQVRHGGVFAVQQAELIVRQLLLLGHHVLGQFQQRILVAPEQLADRHFDEWLDLQNVHDGRHR